MSKDRNYDKERRREQKRKQILAKIASFCIKRNFKFDVISPKKWITLTFESRNEKQDQGIDIFIDVKTSEDIYFVIPAAYDVLFDEEIPAVLKAVNINNNFINPARCSFSERSKKVIVDYTYPLIDGDITLEQFSRVLMFILESAEALRDNITKVQKRIENFDADKNTSPIDNDMKEKIEHTKKYLSKLGAVLGEEMEDEDEEAKTVRDKSNIFDSDDPNFTKSDYPSDDEDDEEYDEDEFDEDDDDEYDEDFDETDEQDEEEDADSEKFGYRLVNFFDDIAKNFDDSDDEDSEEDDENDIDDEEEF